MIQNKMATAFCVVLIGFATGCGSPAMYRPAVAKLTAATNIVIDSGEHILGESQRAQEEASIIELTLYGSDSLGVPAEFSMGQRAKFEEKQIFGVQDTLYRPDAVAEVASGAFDDVQLRARLDLLSALKRTNDLLNKIVTEDYADQASNELSAIETRLGDIKGFSSTDPGGKAVSALRFVIKNFVEQKQAQAARRALLDLTARTITREDGTTFDGPLHAVVELLRNDIQNNYSKAILLPSVNSISQARKRYLLSSFCSRDPVARQMALKSFLRAQDNLIAKHEMHSNFARALNDLEASLSKVHAAAETPDFLAILQHLELFFEDTVQLKQALEKSEKEGQPE